MEEAEQEHHFEAGKTSLSSRAKMLQGPSHYTRGLEKHTAKNNEKLVLTRQLLYASVFKIQSLDLPEGIMDIPGTIADICVNISKESKIRAHQLGIADAEAAKKAYLQTGADLQEDSFNFARTAAAETDGKGGLSPLFHESVEWEQI